MKGLSQLFFVISLIQACLGAHIIKDKDEAHHVTQKILKKQKGFKHKHDDVQALRDEFNTLKEAAHAADPELVHAINHKGRSRSFTDEVKHRNLERAVRGEKPHGVTVKTLGDIKKEKMAKKRERDRR